MSWNSPPRPTDLTESRLITAILSGRFPIDSNLPAERELAVELGVTRPTLREALQRISRDGWVEIRQGRPTRVRDYWIEGNLGVLSSLARFPEHTPNDFVDNLLTIRLLLAPAYTRMAVAQSSTSVIELLTETIQVNDDGRSYVSVDWQLHHQLTILSGNPIFTLILNGFEELYCKMAEIYFSLSESREHSRGYYMALMGATRARDLDQVEALTRETMGETLSLWSQANSNWQKDLS
jgi:GntR family negative regulator for fad regulon and positive regulator of fabA